MYKAVRHGKRVIKVSFAYSSQECAECAFTSLDKRPSQAVFVCQRYGREGDADHNAARVIANRGVWQRLSGEPLTTPKKSTRLFHRVGPERPQVTPGQADVRRLSPVAKSQWSMSQELSGVIPETPTSTRQG